MNARQERIVWGAKWVSKNHLDGVRSHILNGPNSLPRLFLTRADARAWVAAEYGYLRRRFDLRAEPHGWRMPQVVRLRVAAVEGVALSLSDKGEMQAEGRNDRTQVIPQQRPLK